MDFLKTCSTNIQRFDDVQLVNYAVYTSSGTSTNATACSDILPELREVNILCCEHENQLYIFNAPTEHKLDSESFKIEEEGTLHDHTASPLLLLDRLKDAVEQGMTFRLANDKRVLKLGLWSWLSAFDTRGTSPKATLTQIHVKFVPPGSLIFVASSRQVPLSAIPEKAFVETQTIVLSPAGVTGTLIQKATNGRDEQDPGDEVWKADLTRALKCYGIVLDSQELWVHVELQERSSGTILWPLRLCLAKNDFKTTSHRVDNDLGDWLDPLTFAQQWAASAEERRQKLLEAQQAGAEAAEMNTADDEMSVVTSPPFQHRPGLSNLAGVYPTPPDGMLNTATANPSIQHDTSALSQQDLSTDNNDLFRVQTNDVDNSLGIRPRGPSIASSVGMELQPNSTDDLFGDNDAELGGDEVDEDDFDFFDDEADALAAQTQGRAPIAQTTSTPAIPVEESSQMQLDDMPDFTMSDVLSSPSNPVGSQLSNTDHDQEPTTSTADHTAPNPQTRSSASLPKSLSPFDIRERLLPPPVPASISSQNHQISPTRRQSTFAPIAFNPDLKLGARARTAFNVPQSPAGQHQSLATSPVETPATFDAYGSPSHPLEHHSFSSSDDDSSDSSVERTRAMPPDLPWQTRKRKRFSVETEPGSWNVQASPTRPSQVTDNTDLLRMTLEPATVNLILASIASQDNHESRAVPLETRLGCNPPDLLMIAQIVSEQAVTCTGRLVRELDRFGTVSDSVNQSWPYEVSVALQDLLPSKSLDPTGVAMQRDSQRPSMPLAKGQPRPPPRLDIGPGAEAYPIAAPYMRFQRAESKMEMLPPAVHFWEALSLAPSNAGKDIRLYSIFPDHASLKNRLPGFRDDLTAAYEGCKLGVVHEDTPPSNSQCVVKLDKSTSETEAFVAYSSVCRKLVVEHLVERAFTNPDCSFVILMVETSAASVHTLSACFWSMYRTYRDRVVLNGFAKKASDLCLQILPASLICSFNNPTILSSTQAAILAREIYDRCPPGEEAIITSPLSIAAVPSLVLADALPKRINFQLTANAPTDLLHEGSELHVAYARSTDGLWITAVWSDNTGAEQHISSFCVRGTSIAAVLSEIWNRSLDILRARQVAWRLGIATAGDIDELEVQCWRDIMSTQTPRRVAIHASLVLVQPTPLLAVRGPSQDITSSAGPGGVITPVSTPQASGFIVSPDATGQTAPPTPAPTEPSTETDPDAHLVDLPDETWAMLLDPKVGLAQHEKSAVTTIAQGVLVKHGQGDDERTLPIAGISIAFTLRIRGSGSAVEDATPKQAEIILKELLSAYRGLSLLTKARGLQDVSREALPLHIVSAQKCVAALNGLLHKHVSE